MVCKCVVFALTSAQIYNPAYSAYLKVSTLSLRDSALVESWQSIIMQLL
ncbi:hypothetical protein [Helicobacter rodentium]|nr:hypothetical protein [Helicobacter rodentium]